MNITNKTKRPLRLPLPGDKTLFLAPGGTGQVSPKARHHPPLVALVDAGDVEFDEGSRANFGSGDEAKGVKPSSGHGAGGGIRKSGDR